MQDGTVVRALTSQRCGPDGWIPGPGVTWGLSWLLVLVPTPKVFPRVLRFSSLHKNIYKHTKFQFNSEIRASGLTALLWMSPSLNNVIYFFVYFLYVVFSPLIKLKVMVIGLSEVQFGLLS